jgi:hypothetical protein
LGIKISVHPFSFHFSFCIVGNKDFSASILILHSGIKISVHNIYFFLLWWLKTDKRIAEMGLSRFPDASEGGAMAFFMIYAALCISTVKGFLISLIQKMGLKADTGTPELAEEESSDLSSGISQLAMTAEEREDRLPVALLETSSSLCSCSDGDGVSEGVEFHGGEETCCL